MTTNAPMDPTPVLQMLQASQVTAALKTAIDLGVFAALADSPRSAATVAEQVGCPARTTGLLLDALVVIGLVVRDGASYALTPLAQQFLVPGGPTYVGDMSNIFAGPLLWDGLGKLTDAVRAGGSVMTQHAEAPSHPFWEVFARSSASFAAPSAEVLAQHLAPLTSSGKKVRVLDVAAGSGLYGYTLMRSPNVEVTFLDWPNVLPETRAWGERLGADMKRAHFLPGSAFDVDLGGPYDVVLASHLFHHFEPKACQTLMRRLGGAVAPGGRVAVNDFISGMPLDNPGATMFSLVMLVWTRSGQAYTEADYTAWMAEAGLGRPTTVPLPGMPTSWLLAERR